MEKILAQKAVPKGPEWPSYGNLGKVTQNPHFLKKCKGGTKRKFFKNHPKSSPCLKGPKALAQVELYSNLNALKVQKLKKISAQRVAPKVSE